MNKINLKKVEDFHISQFHSHNNQPNNYPFKSLIIMSPKKMIVVSKYNHIVLNKLCNTVLMRISYLQEFLRPKFQ